jgi:transcriptional regulator with XRE-family HTH domain
MERTAPLHTIAAALRRERERHGISLAELARRAGIAKSTLSQLESGAGNPSVETLWSLAVVLDVPFSRLLDPPAAPVHVVRASDRPVVRAELARFTSTLLAACPRELAATCT